MGGCCYRRHISEKIHRTAHSRYCYSRHNSFFPGQSGCYPAHNSQKSAFFCGASCRGLLVCAQFALQGPGLLSTAQYKDFSARVVIQRTFPRGRIFPSALLECCAHFSLFLFRARGCYTRHFLKIPQNFLCRHFPAKKLFYCCYASHIVAFYTFVLECCAQHRCNTAHICVGRVDIAVLRY